MDMGKASLSFLPKASLNPSPDLDLRSKGKKLFMRNTSESEKLTDKSQRISMWTPPNYYQHQKVFSYQYDMVSVFSIQGKRTTMEDKFRVVQQKSPFPILIFGVFDGHGGSFAVEYVESKLIPNILNAMNHYLKRYGVPPVTATTNAKSHNHNENNNNLLNHKKQQSLSFHNLSSTERSNMYNRILNQEILSLDKLLLQKADTLNNNSGTTCLLGIMFEDDLVLANTGDCRAIMYDSKGRTLQLTVDHKPQNSSERERIRKAGGFVTLSQAGIWRLNGILSVSRGFGDLSLKRYNNVITAKPDIHIYPLSLPAKLDKKGVASNTSSTSPSDQPSQDLDNGLGTISSLGKHQTTSLISNSSNTTSNKPSGEVRLQPRFLVLASDGLWNSMSNTEVTEFLLSTSPTRYESNPHTAHNLSPRLASATMGDQPAVPLVDRESDFGARALSLHALRLGSTDNVTVMIVKFISATNSISQLHSSQNSRSTSPLFNKFPKTKSDNIKNDNINNNNNNNNNNIGGFINNDTNNIIINTNNNNINNNNSKNVSGMSPSKLVTQASKVVNSPLTSDINKTLPAKSNIFTEPRQPHNPVKVMSPQKTFSQTEKLPYTDIKPQRRTLTPDIFNGRISVPRFNSSDFFGGARTPIPVRRDPLLSEPISRHATTLASKYVPSTLQKKFDNFTNTFILPNSSRFSNFARVGHPKSYSYQDTGLEDGNAALGASRPRYYVDRDDFHIGLDRRNHSYMGPTDVSINPPSSSAVVNVKIRNLVDLMPPNAAISSPHSSKNPTFSPSAAHSIDPYSAINNVTNVVTLPSVCRRSTSDHNFNESANKTDDSHSRTDDRFGPPELPSHHVVTHYPITTTHHSQPSTNLNSKNVTKKRVPHVLSGRCFTPPLLLSSSPVEGRARHFQIDTTKDYVRPIHELEGDIRLPPDSPSHHTRRFPLQQQQAPTSYCNATQTAPRSVSYLRGTHFDPGCPNTIGNNGATPIPVRVIDRSDRRNMITNHNNDNPINKSRETNNKTIVIPVHYSSGPPRLLSERKLSPPNAI